LEMRKGVREKEIKIFYFKIINATII